MSASERVEAIQVAWDAASGLVGDAKVEARKQCYADAAALVIEEPTFFADLEGKQLDRLVRLIDSAREAGDSADVMRIKAYMLVAFEPQNIGGTIGRAGR